MSVYHKCGYILFACGLLGSQLTFAGNKDSIVTKFAETITSEDLSKHLHIIASDEYEGRETGLEGQKKAATYISSYFKSIGILPMPQLGSYYQSFPLFTSTSADDYITVNGKKYNLFEDYFHYSSFKDTIFKFQEIVFMGYGISDDNYNDYLDQDVKGKVIMYFDGEPQNKKGKYYVSDDMNRSEWSTRWKNKLRLAKEKGVVAVLVVSEEYEGKLGFAEHRAKNKGMKLDNTENRIKKVVPNFFISDKLANDLLSGSKHKGKLASVKKKIDKTGSPINFVVDSELTINIDAIEENFEAENVLGYIEGTDLKDEVLIITAHYDHIGVRGDDVFNGADDDGSGTVALLEIAEAFMEAKKQGMGSRRSILIMPVSGEEKGLLGSQYYVDNPVLPLENTIADLNIDMIGRWDTAHVEDTNYVYLIGSDRLSQELHDVSEEMNKTYLNMNLDYTFNEPDDPNRFYYRSDHYNFASNNIPVIFYFCGVHIDYHQATDTVDKIHFGKMETITRLVFYTAWELANRDDRVRLNESKTE